MSEPLIEKIHKVNMVHPVWGVESFALGDKIISLDSTIKGVITGINFYDDINLAVEVDDSGDWYPLKEFGHDVPHKI